MTTAELIAKLREADPNGAGTVCWDDDTNSLDIMVGPSDFRRIMSLGNEQTPFVECLSCPWPSQCGELGVCEAGR